MSAGPVAAGGGAEAVENILQLGFANTLRLGVATAALLTRNLWERFPRVGADGPSGADRQPGADGFESRWDSRMEAKKTEGRKMLIEPSL